MVKAGGKKKRKGEMPTFEKKAAGPNLFERMSNKKRFDVMGKKVKGETRHTGRLRTAAVEKRKSTLLVEYKQLRKSNAFIDRRFGEDDASLTADEKAILRFQKQRLKEMAGGKFALPDDDGGGDGLGGGGGESLTHLGQSLADANDLGEGWASDDDGGLDDAVTRDLHFGGGLFERKQGAADGADGAEGEGREGQDGQQPQRKSKKEVMEELIAKSKMYKAIKAQQKEEDFTETERLDAALSDIMAGGLKGLMRPKGVKRDNKAETEEDRRFDLLTRELVFETKAAPGERTKTAEELAELERQRLEGLEKQRVKRQRAEGSDGEEGGPGDEAAAAPQPAGGFAARRAKRARREALRGARLLGKGTSGDAQEDDFELGSGSDEDASGSDGSDASGSEEEEEEEEGGRPLTALEKRRRARAGGEHPLQANLRAAAARLLAKHDPGAAAAAAAEEEEEEEEGSEEEGDSDVNDGSDGEAAEESISEGEEEEEEEEEEGSDAPSIDAVSSSDEEAAAAPSAAAATEAAAPGALPFTPPLPETYEEFAALAAGLSADDLGELVSRIRAYNAAALTTANRRGMQLLYGVLTQHFASLAAAAPLPLRHLDALLPHMLELTPMVPFYSATLARARLEKAHARLLARLRDQILKADAWPGAPTLMLLKLFVTVFPASDKRHPVLTPASLLAASCLANCPVTRPRDVATGLYLASLLLHLHAPAGRFAPEPLNFAVALLRSAAPAGASPSAAAGSEEGAQPRWLCVDAAAGADGGARQRAMGAPPATPAGIEPLDLVGTLGAGGDDGDSYWTSPNFKTSAAAAAARLVQRVAASLAGLAALPEIMEPALRALRPLAAAGAAAPAAVDAPVLSRKKMKKKGATKESAGAAAGAAAAPAVAAPSVAPGLATLCAEVAAAVEAGVAAVLASRRPLCNTALLAIPEARQYNPRYEENYATGKDYDPDRERSERRKLQRAVRREERGAVRELRKDAAFMSGVKDKEKASQQNAFDASARKAMAFLQQQESDFKSGGQGGMWNKNKNKNNKRR